MSGYKNYGTLTQWNTMQHKERRINILPFAIAWMEMETIILSETSQSLKEKIPYDLTYKRNLMNKIS